MHAVNRDLQTFVRCAELLLRLPPQLRLCFPKPLGLQSVFVGLARQLHEHADLRFEHFRLNRRQNVVHRAQRVALEHMGVVCMRRQENDGGVGRCFSSPDQLGRLETVHSWHVHIEKNHCEALVENMAQRLFAGLSADDRESGLVEYGTEGHEILLFVVDEQNLHVNRSRRYCGRRTFHDSRTFVRRH